MDAMRPLVRSAAALSTLCAALATAQGSSLHVRVDAFGYRPLDRKVAVLREPVVAYDAPAPFTPSAVLEVRRASDASLAFSAARTAWNGGALHAQSGDRAWWFDFSALQETGSYYVRDPASGSVSETFDVRADVYEATLAQAARMFFYQRCGVPKLAAHAGAAWSDAACHVGTLQDLDCRSILDASPATSRDLSGGWHDAGDYNKYVNFATYALHQLLAAYEAQPCVWSDAYGIPQSANGTPDLLDEVRHELEWLLRMQNADGSVLHKVSVNAFQSASPPSADAAQRRYAPPTASATISACGAFAHASVVFASLPNPSAQSFAAQLASAAASAWTWLEANPAQIPSSYDNAGFQNVSAEISPYDQTMRRVAAAAWLFRATGTASYRAWFDANYATAHLFQWSWAAPWESEHQNALLAYTQMPGATSSVRNAIRSAYAARLASAEHLGKFTSSADAYRSWLADQDYTWGSNRTKCEQGLMFAHMRRYALDVANAASYEAAAQGFLHWIHGVNPTGFTFVTNLASHGAPSSVRQTYHAWFAHGTAWDEAGVSPFGPAPGFLTGGVNPSFAPDPAFGGTIAPPQNQPIQKSYKDWNTSWPENSWEVTECHLPYQASYVALLAHFATSDFGVAGTSCAGELASVVSCAGDGGGAACPCGNQAPLGSGGGCLNSLGLASKLRASGSARLASDTLVLTSTSTPDSSVLFFQGTSVQSGGAGAAFGDGLRCAAGTIVRLATHTASGGASSYPSSGEPSVSTRGAVVSPGTREYQAWYRNAASFCTSSTFNLTNGLRVTWAP